MSALQVSMEEELALNREIFFVRRVQGSFSLAVIESEKQFNKEMNTASGQRPRKDMQDPLSASR